MFHATSGKLTTLADLHFVEGSAADMSKKRRSITSNLGSMAAAMIPGAKVDNKGRISVNVGTNKETIVFNIGGAMFETYRSTLHRLPNSPLANEKFLKDHYRPEKKDYFFDRDPDIFRATLNYLRTGELHLPSYICGPAAKMELQFWGVVPSKIERCCWTNYNDWNSTLDALEQLDEDRRGSLLDAKMNAAREHTWWNVTQPKIWNFFNNPHSSKYAKYFGFMSLFLVFISVFSFIASTTPTFTVVCTPPETIDVNLTRNGSAVNETTQGDHVEPGRPYLNSTKKTSGSDFTYDLVSLKHDALLCIDLICLLYFTLEYAIRVTVAPSRLKFVTSISSIVDLIAIVPDYVEIVIITARPELIDGCEVPFIAFAKILRIVRIYRLVKYVPGLWILIYTLKASSGELILLTCFMSLGVLLFSSLIYFVDSKETFSSIPESFWWALITMTTVGYGDMFPTTALGKLVGSMCAMTGLLMIGFSVPALVNNFMLYYKHVQYSIQAERIAKLDGGSSSADKTNGLNGVKGQGSFSNGGSFSASAFLQYDQGDKENGAKSNGETPTPETDTEVSPLVTGTNNNVV